MKPLAMKKISEATHRKAFYTMNNKTLTCIKLWPVYFKEKCQGECHAEYIWQEIINALIQTSDSLTFKPPFKESMEDNYLIKLLVLISMLELRNSLHVFNNKIISEIITFINHQLHNVLEKITAILYTMFKQTKAQKMTIIIW